MAQTHQFIPDDSHVDLKIKPEEHTSKVIEHLDENIKKFKKNTDKKDTEDE